MTRHIHDIDPPAGLPRNTVNRQGRYHYKPVKGKTENEGTLEGVGGGGLEVI